VSTNSLYTEGTSAARTRLAPNADGNRTSADGLTAVETFMFEVSAGKRLGQPLPAPGVIVPAPAGQTAFDAEAEIATTRQPAVRLARPSKKRRKMPSWLGSGLFHLAAIVPLGFMTIPGLQQSFDFTLSLNSDPGLIEEVAIADIDVEALADFDGVENQLAAEVVQTSYTANELNAEAALSELSSSSLADAAANDVAGLFGSEGLSEMVPSGDKLTASFFGTKVEGRRILYVLDNSGGMKDGGLETLVDELLRSVESLSPKQEFYVIFYSDMVYPLFHPRSIERFVPANDRFKERLKKWLDSVELSVGNSVDQAILAASVIRPDAVYLLTDGDVNTTPDGRKLDALLDTTGRDFPIHTFGIGMGDSTKAADNLRRVAEANGGTFRIVDVSDEAKTRAKTMNRPYHNKEPGRDWGLNVGGGWGR
jgi:von Willebrand factor type A domain